MRVLVIGGGPGGLYTALLIKRRDPLAHVEVIDRNRPDDTFGWGVVLSDLAVANLHAADPPSAAAISDSLHHWDDIEVHFAGEKVRSGGHGFSGIGRHRLLAVLQARCRELGVQLSHERELKADEALDRIVAQQGIDVVVAADGLNSSVRNRFSETYKPDIDVRRCRYTWLGTPRRFDAFTFAFAETASGWFQAHAYQFAADASTFIVETPWEVWERAGLEDMSAEQSVAYCERLFEHILQGAPLRSNASHLRGSAQWLRFPRITCAEWVHWLSASERRVPVVLLGDAAHTAHFSVGSGTRLAMEDAIALDAEIAAHPTSLDVALARYQADRSVEVLKLQNAARNSTEWFEHVERYARLAPEQFAYSLLTRSQRISHENLRVRDSAYVQAFERWFAERSGLQVDADTPPPPAILTPFRVRSVTLPNRIVVSPMAQYTAEEGLPTDWHFVHLGARATGGAGLVMTEMTCVSPEGRITPWCTGLWNETQRDAWIRIVRFVHEHTPAKIGLQLGHSGAKGATKKMWEGVDQPLPSGEWPVMSASATQYLPGVSQVARPMTEADMDRVTEEFVRATRFGIDAGFDWLELHAAHGYLLSSFLSPLTNLREDEYGGDLAARTRFPLRVFTAMRAEWPSHLPMSVRISAHDWMEGGNTADDAVEIARMFRAAGADVIDVSAGQVVNNERPVFGRMWMTPFADRIRQEACIATMAVGAITDADQANGIIASGRADLVAVGRPHLVNPAWTLSEAARWGYQGATWPDQYLAGKHQLERVLARERAMAGAAAAPGGQASAGPPRGELT